MTGIIDEATLKKHALDTRDMEALLGVTSPGSAPALRRRTLLVVILVTIAVLAAIGWWFRSAGAPTVRYTTRPASVGDLVVTVTATGSAQPITQVNISSELSGTVRKVLVDYNSPVKAGQPLAELDVEKLKAAIESVRARMLAAQARVADAAATVEERRGQLERKRSLTGKEYGSVQELEQAKAAYDRAIAQHASALAEVKVSEADLHLAEINLNKACICSPIDGVILKRTVDPGQIVASSLQAPVLFVIAQDLREMELQVDVDEADVGRVKVGQKASFSVDAYPDRKFPAQIRDVRYGSEVVQGVVTYKAVLSIENAELLIRPGMTATAEIVVTEVKNALTVPSEAVRYSPATNQRGGQSQGFLQMLLPRQPSATMRPPSPQAESGPNRTIWVLQDNVPARVRVVLGPTDGRRTQILKGDIAPGQAVIVDATAPAR
ncbi:MAG: efflux RND transporter periplasmic adaptor subunit [Beijerinckiaceae bacterium]|nr:efflux RND transporter periplasmic adaptor subunit [Beijerinckiaceae bacterium]